MTRAETDARTIERLEELHAEKTDDAEGSYCAEDGFAYPCNTKRIIDGET